MTLIFVRNYPVVGVAVSTYIWTWACDRATDSTCRLTVCDVSFNLKLWQFRALRGMTLPFRSVLTPELGILVLDLKGWKWFAFLVYIPGLWVAQAVQGIGGFSRSVTIQNSSNLAGTLCRKPVSVMNMIPWIGSVRGLFLRGIVGMAQGIEAARKLEAEDIQTHLTLVYRLPFSPLCSCVSCKYFAVHEWISHLWMIFIACLFERVTKVSSHCSLHHLPYN